MRRGDDPVACPQPRLHRRRQAGHRMRGEEARQAFGHKRALQGESRHRPLHAAVGREPLQGIGHADLEVPVVEAVQRRVVADHAFRVRRHAQHVHPAAVVERGHRLRELAEGPLRRVHQGPVAAQATDHQRLARSHHIGQREIACVVGELGDGRAHAMAVRSGGAARSVRERTRKRKRRALPGVPWCNWGAWIRAGAPRRRALLPARPGSCPSPRG